MSFGTQVALSAAIGGTAEALGGGKFANGAVTGAYVMMFNHLQDKIQEKKDPWANFDEAIDYGEESPSRRAIQIINAWKYSIENGMDGEIPLYRIFTNLKCGDVLKNSGILINSAPVIFGDKTIKVTIRVNLYNSTKRLRLSPTTVQFGGEEYNNPVGTNMYRIKNNDATFGVDGLENYEAILKWIGYYE